MNIVSEQIENHPSIIAEERENASITCAKTSGADSEWKFLIKISNIEPILELYYSMNRTQLEELGIRAHTVESENTATDADMQNYSIILINVQKNMTGIAVVCGAKMLGQGQFKFFNKAAVLIVSARHSKGQYYSKVESKLVLAMFIN